MFHGCFFPDYCGIQTVECQPVVKLSNGAIVNNNSLIFKI